MLKHGHAGRRKESSTYVTWVSMIQRCYGVNATSYPRYGGRGIAVCDRWRNGDGEQTGFECFLADMGDRPSDKSIEREDPNGHYSPENCRWADRFEQARNRRSTRWVLFNGKKMALVEAVELSGQKVDTVKKRLARGWSLSKALQSACVDVAG